MEKINIPQSQVINYGQKPLDFSLLSDAIDKINWQRMQVAKEQRLKINEIEKQVKDFDPGKIMGERNQIAAAKELKDFHDQLVKDVTYQKDEKGGLLHKLRQKIGTEPTLTDEENAQLMQKGAELAAKYKQWDDWSKQASKIKDAYVNNPGKYDPINYQMYMGDYMESNNGSGLKNALQPAPVNPMDPKILGELDPRTPEQKKLGAPVLSPDGKTITSTQPSADPEKATMAYYQRSHSDYAYQRGLVDAMMGDKNTTPQQKIEYIMGTLAEGAISDPQVAQMARQEATRMVQDYQNNRNFDPKLIESAIFYGDHVLKIPSLIGKGYTKTALNLGRINHDANKAADQKTSIIQPTVVEFPGLTSNNYVSTSQMSNADTELKHFTLPEKAVKYINKIDKYGKPIPFEVKGQKAPSIRIDKPVETKQANDYIIDGWDKEKNVIRLIKANQKELIDKAVSGADPNTFEPIKGGTEISRDIESYIIPYKGNERLIDPLLKKMSGKNTDTYTGTQRQYTGFLD